METLKDVFDNYKAALKTVYEPAEIKSITALVVNTICNISTARIKAFPDLEITKELADRLAEALRELQTGKPVQYILGETEFYGLPFKVNSSVLIPRPETEELVEWAIDSVANSEWSTVNDETASPETSTNYNSQPATHNILDIGTGSGCIAIGLKKHLRGFNVSAIDISADALATAQQNAELNKVEVTFIQANILLKSEIEIPKFEIIISNPPYVTQQDKKLMHRNVTDFEPHTALFVPEDDPLIFYKAIAGFAENNLTKNGLLFLEINESLGDATFELLKNAGFKTVELRKDLSGKDRMIKASL